MKKNGMNIINFIIVILVIALLYSTVNQGILSKSVDKVEFEPKILEQQIENNEVSEIVTRKITEKEDTGEIEITLTDGTKYKTETHSLSELDKELSLKSISKSFIYKQGKPIEPNILLAYLPTIITVGLSLFMLYFIFQSMQGSNNKAMSFGKSQATIVLDPVRKVTFEDVAGLDEEKVELREIIDFFKHSKEFIEMGARIPKGVLLVGPPGTGKTLLAKAVAGESGVPFFNVSGSDFVEMFVGVGASRVRDLFEQAKKNSPCIIFIDEIDAIGRKRERSSGGGNQEREQTLNQLLVEMDGFGTNEGVIVLAATNRSDVLDNALTRPGRFDREVNIGMPDVGAREEILRIHSKNKKIGPDFDFKTVALTTSGFTPAELENLMNESALLAVRNNKPNIDMESMRRAFIKIGMGTEKKSAIVSDKEKRLVAYHESGHAVVTEVLPNVDSVHIISIIPTGRASGYMMPIPDEETNLQSKSTLLEEISVFYGGRIAEELFIGDITIGASNDIERATFLAREMVTRYGMSPKLGPIRFHPGSAGYYEDGSLDSKNYGPEIEKEIDSEVKKILNDAYELAKKIIQENEEVIHKTVRILLEKEKITGEEFRELFEKGVLTKEINDLLAFD